MNDSTYKKRACMNFIHIAGHLGADPETRFTSTGKKVITMRVASKTRKGQTDDTIWYRVTIWGDQYDKMIPHFKKGSPIVVAGELQKPDIFNDRDGKPQISMDITVSYIQFSPFGKPGTSHGHEGSEPSQVQKTVTASPSTFGMSSEMAGSYMSESASSLGKNNFDDEIPF
jgi:single-strand DNA-binding protein